MVSNIDAIRASVRDIIVSIKPLENGFQELPFDAPLFKDATSSVSPVNLDSLDVLDLAMSIGNDFGLDDSEFDRLMETEDGLKRLRTVNDITDLILSLTSQSEGVTVAISDPARKEVTA